MRNYFLIETAFTHRKFVFPPLEKNGQAHVAIATDVLSTFRLRGLAHSCLLLLMNKDYNVYCILIYLCCKLFALFLYCSYV